MSQLTDADRSARMPASTTSVTRGLNEVVIRKWMLFEIGTVNAHKLAPIRNLCSCDAHQVFQFFRTKRTPSPASSQFLGRGMF